MATFYKRGGKKNKDGYWYIQYMDETGKRRSVKGAKDKEAAKAIARKLESDAALRKAGVIDATQSKYAEESKKPLSEHLNDFKENALSRGVTQKQSQTLFFRAKRIFELANAKYMKDISSSAVQSAIAQIKDEGKSLKTCNEYLAAAKQFCIWARRDKRIQENPLDHLEGYNTALDRRHDRRALSDEEVQRLIKAAANGPTLQKCSGPERALIYKLSVLTGLRKNEISTLTKKCFKLDYEYPTVTVEAAFSKHRREDTIPLPQEIIPELKEHIANKSDEEKLFKVPSKTFRCIKEDLEAAGIQYETSQGFADFHSLRHTFVSRLINSGVNPKTAQLLARHSDARLTLGVYSHVEIIDQHKAIKGLPRLNVECIAEVEREEQIQATGTHSKNSVGSVGTYVGSQAALSEFGCHSKSEKQNKGAKNNDNKLKMLDRVCHGVSSKCNNIKYLEAAGVEPASETHLSNLKSDSNIQPKKTVSAHTSARDAENTNFPPEIETLIQTLKDLPEETIQAIVDRLRPKEK